MPESPLEFMRRYREIRVRGGAEEDPVHGVCQVVNYAVAVRTYFMMDWAAGTDEMRDFSLVTERVRGRGSQVEQNRAWFDQNKERIRTAAMGKGAPGDYALALEWAVRTGRIPNPSAGTIQTFCDEHLGIDCSGFVTNYLIAIGKREDSATVRRNTSAASFFNVGHAVNDPTAVRQGDLLVWMNGVRVKTNPGHVTLVQAYGAESRVGGNLHVVEATGNRNANPKLLDSWYEVQNIIERNEPGVGNQVMILEVKRHGHGGERVAVMRVP
jgi:hypothetical protein